MLCSPFKMLQYSFGEVGYHIKLRCFNRCKPVFGWFGFEWFVAIDAMCFRVDVEFVTVVAECNRNNVTVHVNLSPFNICCV